MAKKKPITRATSNEEGEKKEDSSSDEDGDEPLRPSKYTADPASSNSESEDGGDESDDSQDSSNGKDMNETSSPKQSPPNTQLLRNGRRKHWGHHPRQSSDDSDK